jgi:hypothetical protein
MYLFALELMECFRGVSDRLEVYSTWRSDFTLLIPIMLRGFIMSSLRDWPKAFVQGVTRGCSRFLDITLDLCE